MKIALIILATLALLLVLAASLIWLVGRAQPERHTASISFTVPKSRALVWTTLTDYAAMPKWWPAVKNVRIETRPGGETITWNTDQHGQQIGFRTKEEKTPERLVREIVGDNLAFGGTWTYELSDHGAGGTHIKLTEDGFIAPAFFRGVVKLFSSPEATMREFERHFSRFLAN